MDHTAWTALRCGPKPSVDVTALDAPLTLHRELTARGIAVDVLHPDDDLDGYAVVVAPTLFALTPEGAASLTAFVERGGHLAVTYLSGMVDRHNRVVAGGYPALLRDLLGVRVEELAPLLQGEEVLLDPPGRVRIWTERLRADDAEVVATYASGDLAGLPAVTRAHRGAGTATYVSTHLDRERAGQLVDDLVGRAGIDPVARGEAGLELVRRVGDDASWLFAINHTDRDLRLDVDGLDLVTGERLAAGGTVTAGAVAVIREDAS